METNIKFEFNLQQLDIIVAGLRKLPIEIGLDTLNFIVNSANQQIAEANKPKDKEEGVKTDAS